MIVKTKTESKTSTDILWETKSDNNKYIIQNETGVKYESAIDVGDADGNIKYTYSETNEDIEV